VNPVRRMPARRERGFGLVEMMVTLTVMSAVLAAVFYTLFRSQYQTQRLTNVAEERQMARTAVQLIERECRMAGSGWGRDTVQAAQGGVPWSLWAVNFGYGNASLNDSLTLLGAWQAATTLSAPMANETSTMQVTSSSGFAVGDFVIVTNGNISHMFQVTGVPNVVPNVLQHANTSTYNTGHILWPLGGGYATGSNVYKVTMATYRFDSTSYKKPALVRTELGKAPQIVAYNVTGFRVWYELQDGTWTRNPVLLTFVDKVIPVVLTSVTDPRTGTIRDSVWASIRPRTF